MKSDITFFKHILDEINFLQKETKDQSFDQFMHDELTKRAYSRSLEIIGEAVKNISPSFQKDYQSHEKNYYQDGYQ